MSEQSVVDRERGLHQSLSQRQITMIGLGGAIGTGLFMGSGISISYAGPAVLLSYLLAAVIALVMVFSLAEMAVKHPTAGAFGSYAEIYLGPGAGFLVRYTYWMSQIVLMGSEAVAAGTYMGYWYPGVPVWVWALSFPLVLIWINTRVVTSFANTEYWLTVIKVSAIVGFIVVGGAHVLGVVGEPVGLRNLTGLPGGFLPNGWGGVWMATLMAIFSFAGLEFVVATAGEARDPRRAIPAALKTMALRLFLFYVLALAIMVAFLPWTEAGAKVVTQSPFVRMFAHAGIPFAADIMNFVVATAALSAMNTSLYLSSRMLFSLARGGYAPEPLGRLGDNGVPVRATLLSGSCILLAAGIALTTPFAYNYLLGISLFGLLLVWGLILLSHLRFRRAHPGPTLEVRMPLFPWAQYLGLALLGAFLVTMALDSGFWNIAIVVGLPWCAAVLCAWALWKRLARGVASPAQEAS